MKTKEKLENIDKLSRIAASLEGKPAITEANGQLLALEEYLENNKNNELYGFFKYLKDEDIKGYFLLNDATLLAIYERNFRVEGMNKKSLEGYEEALGIYRKSREKYINLSKVEM